MLMLKVLTSGVDSRKVSTVDAALGVAARLYV